VTEQRTSSEPQPGEPEPTDPQPADPEQVGVEPETPDVMQVEAARLLANDARDQLRDRGFGDRQIDRWANTYVADHGSGDLDTFLSWVARQERTG
jgi:hypothetical protein